ncbi:hypothetical protein B0T22DRAFT_297104 [Podospora appendiculata]|uniref:Uncharacterized protein n=1 Tax=Podospora appendiculata TaxID=314037 RepID=A0AAE0X1P9_9PEZI|nr:hypothetical protein B0T22DRAFT_297104 [Podospora appendiculata]
MNIPFSITRPNMDRFNFLTRGRDNQQPTSQPASRNPRLDFPDDDDDTVPLSPRPLNADLESQRPSEMTERNTSTTRFLQRGFRPSFLSVASSRPPPRPASSHYSGDGQPPDTVVNGGAETPKTPRFRIGIQTLPSTRLHLPNLTRTWTQGSNGPPSRPGTAARAPPGGVITEPVPAYTASSSSGRRARGADPAEELAEEGRRRRQHRRERSDESRRSGHRSQREGGEDSRRRRRRRERERERGRLAAGQSSSGGSGSGSSHDRERKAPPKHFMFCFPWVKSRRVRTQILRCFVSGLLLALLLSVYLALSITKNINSSEFTVLIILIILFVTIFFCHALIRLCMLVLKGGRGQADVDRSQLPQMFGPGGYAIPRQPIRVVMARDEEAAGIESETTKINPPAYGLWRESVRVDPNRIYWERNQDAAHADTTREEDEISPADSTSSAGGHHRSRSGSAREPGSRAAGAPRPPSYVSEDGVAYVVEAQPRSIAPTTDVPLGTVGQQQQPHPSESGRAGRPAVW